MQSGGPAISRRETSAARRTLQEGMKPASSLILAVLIAALAGVLAAFTTTRSAGADTPARVRNRIIPPNPLGSITLTTPPLSLYGPGGTLTTPQLSLYGPKS